MAKLDEVPLDAVRDVLRRHRVRAAWVFGSFARGEAQAGSDLDLAVLMAEPWDSAGWFTLAGRLQAALTPLVQRPVDVLVLNEAGSLARFEATSRGIVVLEQDEEERIAFELRAGAGYEDYLHIQSFFVAALRERLERRSAS